jgi:UDP-N-acetylglucosamine:LPS N-acetylglucosamine transferase
MIIVPYPYAGAHQLENAKPYVDGGAALLLTNSDCDAEHLSDRISVFLEDTVVWKKMATASSAMGQRDATTNVIRLLEAARK